MFDSGVYWSGGDFLEAFKENIVYMCIAVGHQIIKKASVIKGKIYINNLHHIFRSLVDSILADWLSSLGNDHLT
jgi:hypothetical protein